MLAMLAVMVSARDAARPATPPPRPAALGVRESNTAWHLACLISSVEEYSSQVNTFRGNHHHNAVFFCRSGPSVRITRFQSGRKRNSFPEAAGGAVIGNVFFSKLFVSRRNLHPAKQMPAADLG